MSGNSWQRAELAARYLGTDVKGASLVPGDIIIGFHCEPVRVVAERPVPHPTCDGWVTVRKSGPYGDGTYVYTTGATVRVGRIPLARTADDVKWGRDRWYAPCGCFVSDGEHCEKCGPYNGSSPLCVNSKGK